MGATNPGGVVKLPVSAFAKVGGATGKTIMKGFVRGVVPSVGSSFNFNIEFDTINADSVYIESEASLNDVFSKVTTIDNKVGIISAKTENLSVGSVDNMTVYYQNDSGSDEIVLVNRIIAKARQMWLQGVSGFGPLQDNISQKIWLDKPADIKKAADNAYEANEKIKEVGNKNKLYDDWLWQLYSAEASDHTNFASAYHTIRGLGSLGRALCLDTDEAVFNNYWGAGPQLQTYTVVGLTKAVKKILEFEQKIDQIKAKTDKIPDDLATRLQSIATDASGANVKAGSAERKATENNTLLKEIKTKVADCLHQVRKSCAWVVQSITLLIKKAYAPFAACFDSEEPPETVSDNIDEYQPIIQSPSFGVSGRIDDGLGTPYVFSCPNFDKPMPYWPMTAENPGPDNFRSMVSDFPQVISAYYWPSSYGVPHE